MCVPQKGSSLGLCLSWEEGSRLTKVQSSQFGMSSLVPSSPPVHHQTNSLLPDMFLLPCSSSALDQKYQDKLNALELCTNVRRLVMGVRRTCLMHPLV